jgi:molybdopterin molybdotransferase
LERRKLLISYNDALQTVLENVEVLEIEDKASFNCAGQVLAEDIYSDLNLPLKDSSGPDGYAVRATDIRYASKSNPLTLTIIETVRAGGTAANPLKPGTAIRIMTGCILPEGADCVVRFEDTDEPENKNGPNPNNPAEVKIYVAEKPGANVRKVGSNVTKGTLLMPKGTFIGPNHISVLMSIGRTTVKVIRRPELAVISTGDELINPGGPLIPGKVYNCNSAVVSAMINHYGGIPRILGVAHDYKTSIIAKMRKGIRSDAIITSGGVSKGDYDLIRVVIEQFGEVKFSRINMGPGASFAFGMISPMSTKSSRKSIPVFALSGPPPGCVINFETLVRPAILKMMGVTALGHPSVEAWSDDSVPDKKPMAFVKWTTLYWENGEYHVRLNDFDKKGNFDSMARANSLTIIPEGAAIRKGDKIKVLVLDWNREYQPCF